MKITRLTRSQVQAIIETDLGDVFTCGATYAELRDGVTPLDALNAVHTRIRMHGGRGFPGQALHGVKRKLIELDKATQPKVADATTMTKIMLDMMNP
jgi:hypothetical protein